MNDFAQDIAGCHGVMKQSLFFKPKATEKERTFVILSGPGCTPETNTARKIKVKWSDGSTDTLSSYDVETLITPEGKRIKQAEPVFTEFDRAVAPGDIKEEKPRLVRRKT